MTLIASVIETVVALAAVRAEWEAMASTVQQPFSAPSWLLAWWVAVGGATAGMRVVTVSDGGELVGVFPLVDREGAWAPMGAGLAAARPLARPGREQEVALAIGDALSGLERPPRAVALEFGEDGPDWARLLGESWNGRTPWVRPECRETVAKVEFGEGVDAWLAGRSSSFRRELRRKARLIEEAGGEFRFATAESLERDLAAFLRLHLGRRDARGGSSLSASGVAEMLATVGAELLPVDRFRLLTLEVGGRAVAAQLALVAGDEVFAWNSGFDESYSKLSPSTQCLVRLMHDAAEKGQRRLDLGPGEQGYKERFADAYVGRLSCTLVPHGRGYARTRGRLALAGVGHSVESGLASALPEPLYRAVRALRT